MNRRRVPARSSAGRTLPALILLAFLLLLCAPAESLQPQAREPDPHPDRLTSVVNPRTQRGSWVADPAGHLRPETVSRLDAMLDALKDSTGVEIAVVVIDSLEQLSAMDAALTLHRRWGVGQREHDNGLVLLWSPAEREVAVSVGYGLEGVIPDARAGRVIDGSIIPAFRDGDFDRGILVGTLALAAAATEDPASRTRPDSDDGRSSGVIAIMAALAGLGVAGGASPWLIRSRRRRKVRSCPNGHGPMQRLPDDMDDDFLSGGEATEERLGSIDYDVWRCESCGHHEAIPWPAFFTKYSKCGSCGRRTLSEEKAELKAATHTSTGLLQVTRKCEHCGKVSRSTREIPMLTHSSSGGSSFGGSSGGGSSFGGGSAGGGGASRSY
jgi:uncharacterized protein